MAVAGAGAGAGIMAKVGAKNKQFRLRNTAFNNFRLRIPTWAPTYKNNNIFLPIKPPPPPPTEVVKDPISINIYRCQYYI